jgi:hypothetical protein
MAPCHHDRRRRVRQQQPYLNIDITERDERPLMPFDRAFTGSLMQKPFRLGRTAGRHFESLWFRIAPGVADSSRQTTVLFRRTANDAD